MSHKIGDQFYPCDHCESENTVVAAFSKTTGKGTWKCLDCGKQGMFAVGQAISIEEMIQKGLGLE
jgi:transcription elongation factor Elf1